ncbi:P-loop containing nucleoside triphosphate hydrolase protein [Suillus bovinus]|uniref:P-loop containing nucleoside triphosphate hydrolase protein n=1 Tax=Suillus bovinus TaxID=48563 RepID=UPI001B880D05|nr:P-loop containing nucleoside triphosphate hydrolase protein [Suillus bovinus]KAG2122464.1 P-loop containing nucleoside triphosphate hydrolase protein [Suillus bovinus]
MERHPIKDIEEADEVGAKMLRDATKAVKALRTAVAWFPDEETKLARKRGAERARKIKTASLVAPGDVEEIWALGAKRSWGDGWREMDNDKLNHLLQFPGGKPALFAELRSKTGLCAWDADAASTFVRENEDMEPLFLLWHQRVGVAAIVDKIWGSALNEGNTPGILIADEVGVGKTALTMGTIAFVIDAYWVQEVAAGRGKPAGATASINLTNLRPAPILAERPYFAGRDAIPNLPHVIIVPNSLINQWYSELRTFFAPGAVEIYRYPSAESEFGDFWNGPWATSATPLIHRIILVTHSIMATLGKVFDTRKGLAGHNSHKASDETRSIRQRKQASKCLWAGREFLSISIDEVHEMRNLTAGFYATLEVTKASVIKLLASGTPLYTGPMDLCNIGRLARIQHFMGKEGDARDKDHIKQLRAARRAMTQEDKNDAAAHTIRLMAGEPTDDEEPEARLRIRKVTSAWITNIKRGYAGRVIRRTVDSKTFDNKKINDTLTPYKMIIVPVHLDDTELDINKSVMAQITGSSLVATLDDSASFNTKFYLDGRTKVAFPHHTSPTYPAVKSLAEWQTVKSSKVDTLVNVLGWHLENDEHDIFIWSKQK